MAEPTSPIERRMTQVEREIEATKTWQAAYASVTAEHSLILSGNDKVDLPGLVKDMIAVKKWVAASTDKEKALMAAGRGTLLGIALSAAVGGGIGGGVIGAIVLILNKVVQHA